MNEQYVGNNQTFLYVDIKVIWYSCSWKFRKIHRATPVLGSLFNKAARVQAATIIKKETLSQVFSNFYKIFRNNFFIEELCVTTSKYIFSK